MTIAALRPTASSGRPPRRGPRALLLDLFAAQGSSSDAAIRPGLTVAGPVPEAADPADGVAVAARGYLAARAEKRLVDRVHPAPG